MDNRVDILLVRHQNKTTNSKLGGKKALNMNLSDYRKEIKLPQNEIFAQASDNEMTPLQFEMERDYVIEDIAVFNKQKNKYEIHIQVQTDIQKVETESKEQKISKLKVNKAELQNIIKEVDLFKAERKESHNQVMGEQENKLKLIRNGLKQKLPKFKDLDVSTDINVIQNLIKRQNKFVDTLISEYIESKTFSIQQMIERFKIQICRSFNTTQQQIKPTEIIVDVVKSKFSQIANYNDNSYSNRILKQQSQAKKVNSKIDNFKGQANLNAMGFSAAGFLKCGFDLAIGTQQQVSVSQASKKTFFSNFIFAAALKTTYHIEPTDVLVTQNFKKNFFDLFNFYAAEKMKVKKQEIPIDIRDQLNSKIKAIINIFGNQIQVGSYVFGSKFKVVENYTFEVSLSQQKRLNIYNLQSNITLKGAGIGSSFVVGGSAELDMGVSSGKTKQQEKKQKGYSISRQYYATPPIMDYYKWLQAIEHNMKHWNLQFCYTQRIKVGRIMQNPMNKPNIKDQGNLYNGFCQYFDTAANDLQRVNKNLGKKDNKQEIICVVGKLGQGKSTFINQMVGQSLSHPCISSSSVKGVTTDVKNYLISNNLSSINTTIIDTPGIFDNMNRGQNMRQQIIKIVYQDGKNDKLKYVDAIIMIVKVTADSRLQIGKQLEEIESIFGNQIYESLLIIINFPNYNVYESKYKQCFTVVDLINIKKVKNTKFDLQKQVFFNVLQNPNTPQYRAHQREILYRVRKLKQFTSKDYQDGANQRRRIIEQRNQKALKELQKLQQQEKKKKMKTQVQDYIQNKFIGCTIRYQIGSHMFYLDLGVIIRTTFWIPTQRGYDLWDSRSRLSLSYRKVDYENGIIQCKLSATAESNKYLVRNYQQKAEDLIGWNSNGDTICIEFLNKSQGLFNFCFAQNIEEVRISFKNTLPKKYIYRNPQWQQNWNGFYWRTGYGIVHSEKASIFTIIRDC